MRLPIKFGISVVAVAVAAALCAGSGRAETNINADPEEQLEAAIHREIVVGDLVGAVEQYRSLAARAGVPRPVSARALLQIGLCQEKSGQRKEAYDTYRRLVSEYVDQTEVI